jgi:adenosylhomocysteine nucleosidase
MGHNWLILTALAMEAKAIAAELGLPRDGVQLHSIGVKARHVDREKVSQSDGILLAGLAGALDPTLCIGDLILDAPIAGPWQDLPIRRGKIYSSDRIIATVAEKRSLFESTRCAAVDMEGKIVREIADAAKVPMIHLRAISDTAADALPGNLSGWIDDFGNPRLPRVMTDLALHPQQIPAMIRLGKNSRLAVQKLAKAVRQIIERW